MKIGTKYWYYEKYKEPKLSAYNSKDDFQIAYTCWKLQEEGGILAVIVESISGNIKMEIKRSRAEKNRLKVGNHVKILRWDGNGVPSKVKILKIKEGKARVVIYCDKGYFHYSKDNCKKNNIYFNWTCKGKKWNKEYQKWIDGNDYYYEK